MKKEDLFQILGETDESLLDENLTEIRFTSGWITAIVSIAACIAVSAGLIYLIPKPSENLRNPAESALQAETSVTTSVQTVTETEQETDFQEIPLHFDFYTATDPTASYEHPYDAHPMIEIEISENPQIIYIHDALDSSGRSKQYEFTVTDTGYRARNNDFTLERIDENTLILHSASNRYKVYDGMTLSRQNTAYYLLKDIQPEDIAYVSWQLPEESEPEFSYPAEQAFPKELAGILQNMHIYARSGCVSYARWRFTVTMQDGTEHIISQAEGLQNRFFIDDTLYYSDTDFYPLAEYIAKMAKQSETVQNTKSIPETTVFTTEPETTVTTESIPETTVRPDNDMAIHLPYMTTEGETSPIPAVLPNLRTTPQAQEITTQSSAKTTTTETIITEPVTETPYAWLQKFYTEIDGIIYALTDLGECEWEATGGQTLTADGEFGAENLNSVRAYPDRKYAVWIRPCYSSYEEIAVSDEEKERIRNTLTIQGMTLEEAEQQNNTEILAYFRDLENQSLGGGYNVILEGERLASYGIEVLGYSKSFWRIYAVVTEEQLKQLPVTENTGYLVGTMMYEDENYFKLR